MSTASIPLAAREGAGTSSIVRAGLVVGIVDLIFANVHYVTVLNVTTPMRISQSIAAGVLGRASFEGGATSASLGTVLHFVIAFIWSAIFYVVLQRSALLRRLLVSEGTALAVGFLYGLVIWAGMRYIVVPLSAAGSWPPGPFDTAQLVSAVGHAILLGIPLALIMRKGIFR